MEAGRERPATGHRDRMHAPHDVVSQWRPAGKGRRQAGRPERERVPESVSQWRPAGKGRRQVLELLDSVEL